LWLLVNLIWFPKTISLNRIFRYFSKSYLKVFLHQKVVNLEENQTLVSINRFNQLRQDYFSIVVLVKLNFTIGS